MRIKLTKYNLRLVSVLMLATGIAVVVLSILLPIHFLVLSTPNVMQPPATAPAASQPATNADLFAELLDVDLQKQLVDPPRASLPGNVADGDATIGLRLTGTIIEPMHRYAVFTDASGKTEIKSVGDKAGGADISDISPDSVTLRLPGRSMVLHTVKPPTIGSVGS